MQTGGVQVCNYLEATDKRLIIDAQMEDASTHQYKCDHAETAHLNRIFAAGYENQEQIRQCRNGKVETDFSNQSKQNALQQSQQCSIGFDSDHEE